MAGKIGDYVRDRISGYTGIAMARCEYLTGCAQIGIKPQGTKPDGGTFDTLYFDEPYVEVLEEQRIKPIPDRETGGPQAPQMRG